MSDEPDIEPVCGARIFDAIALVLVGGCTLFGALHHCDLSPQPRNPMPATKDYVIPAREPWPSAPWRDGPKPHLDNPHNHGQKWRYIHGEKVPADHSPDDHDWDEFDHGRDQCMDDDRDMKPKRK